jgi:hypothetical protein
MRVLDVLMRWKEKERDFVREKRRRRERKEERERIEMKIEGKETDRVNK